MSGVTARVLPCIADHKVVVAEVPFKVPEQAVISRTVWQYANADWDRLRSEFEEANWDCMLAMDPDTASRHLETAIINAADVCIPQNGSEIRSQVTLGSQQMSMTQSKQSKRLRAHQTNTKPQKHVAQALSSNM